MYKLALLGRDIAYTRSPGVHAAIAEATGIGLKFDVFDAPYDRLEQTVDALFRGYDGFFVTKPYKTEIKRFISGAHNSVNLVRCADGLTFNTDGIGFMLAAAQSLGDWKAHTRGAVVLGAGGAARAVVGALTGIGIHAYVLDRTLMNAVRLVADFDGAELYANQPAQMIVNCTDLGHNGEDALKSFCVAPGFEYGFDLVYGGPTPFVRRIRAAGGLATDGGDMLVYQAIEGDKIIFDVDFDTEEVFNEVKRILQREEK